MGYPTYPEVALKLLDNGYEPLPLCPGKKYPIPTGWTTVEIDEAQVDRWRSTHPDAGIGLRTGRLVGVDIDVEDQDLAHELAAEAQRQFGDTLIRVGRWPKRVLLYRTTNPIPKLTLPKLDILGQGQQLVAFGMHPVTKAPYQWVTGDSPCDVPFDALPEVTDAGLLRYLAFAAAKLGHLAGERRAHQRGQGNTGFQARPTRDTSGLVIDGRDAWLSGIAFHAVHDAIDRGNVLDPVALSREVWQRFSETADTSRARQDRAAQWSPADAHRKVQDKLRLHTSGRLPPRGTAPDEPEDLGELLPPVGARLRLAGAIDAGLADASAWLTAPTEGPPPRVGIRATVGLGKSAIARARIAEWQLEMRKEGRPWRVLWLVPSHALAEEAAAAWRRVSEGAVAVLRGYDGTDPATGEPMCLDTEMVELALRESLFVGKSVCYSSPTWHCQHHAVCHKQQNKIEVNRADVVLAPYDVLFTGIPQGDSPFGLIVIDEGCWQRAPDDLRLPPIELLPKVGLSGGLRDQGDAEWLADLIAVRKRLAAALDDCGIGPVTAASLTGAGISISVCHEAAAWEERCLREPKIYPGMKQRARLAAIAVAKNNEIARRMSALWRAAANILGDETASEVLRIQPTDPVKETHGMVLHRHQRIVDTLTGIPILHMDATLRPEIASLLLPGFSFTRIEAAQEHQHLTLVAGSFGKSNLVSEPGLDAEEFTRRTRRLQEVVEYVRWQSRRFAQGRVLVVTHKAIEQSFKGLPRVDTAHFNGIAGLDQYKDVSLIIVVGRPLPSSDALGWLSASLFHNLPSGQYESRVKTLRLRTGQTAAVKTIVHTNAQADLLRAAICDDELLQAIGRGRGVNRTSINPVEVHVLADVALPLILDAVVPWDLVRPDIFQRMLLGGVAVDSPAEAVRLHPGLLTDEKQAQKAFERAGFKRQTPIENPYRGMSLKSATYRRDGRGRSWQRVWWISGTDSETRARLEEVLGGLDGWEP